MSRFTASAFLQELNHVLTRLSELEWQLERCGSVRPFLPPGLFRGQDSPAWGDAIDCVAELRADLRALAEHGDSKAGRFLAQMIQKKIDVLVRFVKRHRRPATESPWVNRPWMMTRQQWLAHLQAELKRLTTQQEVMQQGMSSITSTQQREMLQRELDDIALHIATLKQAFDRVQVNEWRNYQSSAPRQ